MVLSYLKKGEKAVEYSKKEATITITQAQLNQINRYLEGIDHLPEGESITYTAKFDDGMEMEVSCCGRDSKCAYTVAQLFYRGNEVEYSKEFNSYDGIWTLFYAGIAYNVLIEVVKKAKISHTTPRDNDHILRVYQVNLAHLDRDAMEYLERGSENEDPEIHISVFPKTVCGDTYGYFIPTMLDDFEGDQTIPESLRKCLTFVQEKECEYVMFDRDASILPELEVFDR